MGADSDSLVALDGTREARADAERSQYKKSLSGTFDRLVEANLSMVTSVKGLVRTIYVLIALIIGNTLFTEWDLRARRALMDTRYVETRTELAEARQDVRQVLVALSEQKK